MATAGTGPLPESSLVRTAGESIRAVSRNQRIASLLIVLAVAFLTSILASFHREYQQRISSYSDAEIHYAYMSRVLTQLTSLALLAYVAVQNCTKPADFGLTFRAEEIVWGVLLWAVSTICYRLSFPIILSLCELFGWHRAPAFVPGLRLGLGPLTYCFVLVNPVFEEMIVRAFLISETIALTGSSLLAILFSTFLQTSYHIYQGVPYALSYVVVFGMFSVYYVRTRRIIPVILAHFIADALAHFSYALSHPATRL